MGLGSYMKQRAMSREKHKARDRQYQADIQTKTDEAYYKAKEERAISEARKRGASGGFKERLKAGLTESVKKGRANNKKRKGYNMGIRNTMGGGSGPEYGLTNRSAFDLGGSNKNNNSPFSLGPSKTESKPKPKKKGKQIIINL